MDALFHREADHMGGFVDPESQRVDVGGHLRAKQPRQCGLVSHALDAVEQRPERCEAVRLDGCFVQVGRVEVRDLACRGSRLCCTGLPQQDRNASAGEVLELVARPPARRACRQARALEPATVGVCKEIVAGPHVRVNGGLQPRGPRHIGGLSARRNNWPPRQSRRRSEQRLACS